MNEAFGGEGADKLLVRITGGLAFIFMFLAVMISLYPSSGNVDVDNPTLTRNKGKVIILETPSEIKDLDLEDDESSE